MSGSKTILQSCKFVSTFHNPFCIQHWMKFSDSWEVFPHQRGVIKLKNVYSKSVHFGLIKIVFLMQNTWEYCVYSKIFPDAKSLRVLYVF